jgi:hypothetical protein
VIKTKERAVAKAVENLAAKQLAVAQAKEQRDRPALRNTATVLGPGFALVDAPPPAPQVGGEDASTAGAYGRQLFSSRSSSYFHINRSIALVLQ